MFGMFPNDNAYMPQVMTFSQVNLTPEILNAQLLHLMHMHVYKYVLRCPFWWPKAILKFQGDAFVFKEVPLYEAFR